MAKLYSNENFNLSVVDILRALNHDVLTTKDAGKANQGIPDEDVLGFATAENRTVVTFNYQHFKRLHRLFPNHSGIIICTEDKDLPAISQRIHDAIEAAGGNLENQLIRINRPNPSQKL
jgi:predicted nuclease of predicted toxin-antitoxin system